MEGSSGRAGASEKCWECWVRRLGNPTTTARRHYILCLEAVRKHRSRYQ